MGMYISPGNAGFRKVRNGTYVDKSGLIQLVNERLDTPDNLICVSRPRRFGKSFAAKMLCAYYDASCDSHNLFDDLEIAKSPDYEKHLNQYNVLCLDISGMVAQVSSMGRAIADVMPEMAACITEELKEQYPALADTDNVQKCMQKCVEMTGRKFIIVIDEWDAIIRMAKDDTAVQRSYLEFLRSWFKNANFTEHVVAGAYMTGILPIKKDGSQSAISEFREYTMLDPEDFGPYVGFTEEEVKKLCEENHCDFEKMKQWYDGYQIKNVSSVYNPNSVMQVMSNKNFKSYWRQTSVSESLRAYIDMDEDGLQEDILKLLSGESVEVDVRSFVNDFQTFIDKNDVLTLLIHLGYLVYEEIDSRSGYVRIPNYEIREEFEDMLRRASHPELVKMVKMSDKLLQDTLEGDEQSVAEAIEQVRLTNYAATYYNNEQALRYTVKMAYISSVDQYLRVEELPTGRGLADLVFLPKPRSPLPALVVELKWNKTAEGAIAQIKEKKYPALLQGYTGLLVLAGVNYDAQTKEHDCRIERVEM